MRPSGLCCDGELPEPVQLRIGRALNAAQRRVVLRRSVLDAVEEARRELEDRRRVQDARVVDLAYVDVEVVALPHQAPPRRGTVDVDADRPGVERLVLHRDRVSVGRPIVAAEHVLPPRPVDAGLLRHVVVAVYARRVRHRVQIQERLAARVEAVRRNPVTRELRVGQRISYRYQRPARRDRLREIARAFQRGRHLVELQVLNSLGLGVVDDVEEEQLVAGVTLSGSDRRSCRRGSSTDTGASGRLLILLK